MKHFSKVLFVLIGLLLGWILCQRKCEQFGFGPPPQVLNQCSNYFAEVKFGMPNAFIVYPFAGSTSNLKSATVEITTLTGNSFSAAIASKTFTNPFSASDTMDVKIAKWDSTKYVVTVTYNLADGSTCQQRVAESDGIDWVDVVMKPGSNPNCTFNCTSVFSNSASSHSFIWTPPSSGGKIKITIGSDVLIFEYAADGSMKYLGNCNTNGSTTNLDPDKGGFVTFLSGSIPSFKIKCMAKIGTSNYLQFFIECINPCPVQVDACAS